MFERFTGRARHVVVLSQEEARLLNHNYIGTEHILLGLLGEPDSVAGAVLARFGFTLDRVREEVVRRVGRGKKSQAGHIPFTPRAKKTLELALREALQLKHKYIGTEHILLGLIREGEGVAVQILVEHADLSELRAAVIADVPAMDPAEQQSAAEEEDENNAVLRWLRSRLSRHGTRTAVPFRAEMAPGMLQAEAPRRRGTPAVEAALQQAARLAGPVPVGSHHLLLAALEDQNSAASWALASLGVDRDELREKLLAANVAGTSDEQPEQAGRRQMAIEVSDEMLHIVLTDPVIVEAGNEAMRVVRATAGAGEASAGVASAAPAGAAAEAGEGEAGAGSTAVGGTSATWVIRGDHPAAAGLANVWLELRKTLTTLASVSPRRPGGEAPGNAGGEVTLEVETPPETEEGEASA
jgi:ATP-dependent Clp protease ATP-binding subunit ClpC